MVNGGVKMAFKIIEWLKDFGTSAEIKDVSKKQFLSENIPSSDASVGIENWLKLLFFSSAVSRIVSAVASIEYKVYANDVKLYSYSNNGFIEKIITKQKGSFLIN